MLGRALLRVQAGVGRRQFHQAAVWHALKPFLLADIGEGITEVEIVKWCVEPGQKVEEFDPVCEVMSDKATVEITTPYSGTIKNVTGQAGDTIRVGKMLCEIETDEDDAPTTTSAEGAETTAATPTTTTTAPEIEATPTPTQQTVTEAIAGRDVLATPATRRLAREHAIELNHVPGTGKDGRVTKGDVLNFVQGRSQQPQQPHSLPSQSQQPRLPQQQQQQQQQQGKRTIPLTGVRKGMVKAMSASLSIPHFAYSDSIDVTALEKHRIALSAAIPLRYRKALKPAEEQALKLQEEWGTPGRVADEGRIERLTMLPLLLKAMDVAITQHRLFQCTYDAASSALVQHASPVLSIALAGPTGGLFTPSLPPLGSLSPFGIASHLAVLQKTAPRFPAHYTSAQPTMTLSNVGVVGGTTTHPVIPPTGQLAIGALGRTRVVPSYLPSDEAEARTVALSSEAPFEDSEHLRVVPRLKMDVSFTADHRVVEGVELARLVETWKRMIEQPALMLSAERTAE